MHSQHNNSSNQNISLTTIADSCQPYKRDRVCVALAAIFEQQQQYSQQQPTECHLNDKDDSCFFYKIDFLSLFTQQAGDGEDAAAELDPNSCNNQRGIQKKREGDLSLASMLSEHDNNLVSDVMVEQRRAITTNTNRQDGSNDVLVAEDNLLIRARDTHYYDYGNEAETDSVANIISLTHAFAPEKRTVTQAGLLHCFDDDINDKEEGMKDPPLRKFLRRHHDKPMKKTNWICRLF